MTLLVRKVFHHVGVPLEPGTDLQELIDDPPSFNRRERPLDIDALIERGLVCDTDTCERDDCCQGPREPAEPPASEGTGEGTPDGTENPPESEDPPPAAESEPAAEDTPPDTPPAEPERTPAASEHKEGSYLWLVDQAAALGITVPPTAKSKKAVQALIDAHQAK